MTTVVQMKILVGGNTVVLFLTKAESMALELEIRNSKKEWLEIHDRTGKKHSLRSSLIGGYEFVIPVKSSSKNNKTIPIKKLAEFAGVHPITITRNFSSTLAQTEGKSKKFSRATKQTALALFEHLSTENKFLKKEKFLALFGE